MQSGILHLLDAVIFLCSVDGFGIVIFIIIIIIIIIIYLFI
jgi:hypothetical protein